MRPTLILSVLLSASTALSAAPIVIPITLRSDTQTQQTETVTFHFDKPYWFEITADIDKCGPCRYDVSFAHVTMYAGFDDFGYDDTGGIAYDHNYPGGWVPRTVRNIAPAGDFDFVVKAMTWSGRYEGVGEFGATTTIRVWPTPEPTSGVLLGLSSLAVLKRRRQRRVGV